MRRLALTLTLAGALAATAIAPSAASAIVGPMGSTLSLPYQGGVCNANCMAVQLTQAGGDTLPQPIKAPGNGKIVSWAVRTGDPDAIYQLVVLRPTGYADGTFTGFTSVARSPASAPVPAGTTDSIIIYPLGVPVPIKAGDRIGVFQTGAADGGMVQAFRNGIPADKFGFLGEGNTLLDGSAALFRDDVQHELLLQATLDYCKVTDVLGQKAKDARTTLEAAGCTVNTVKKKAKKKKRGTVLAQTPGADGGAADGTPSVELTVGAKKKKKKKKN